jgi:hypothetical protein
MLKLMKNAGTDAPGSSNDVVFSALNKSDNSLVRNEAQHQLVNPLKFDLATQKRDKIFCDRFKLPLNEHLIDCIDATYTKHALVDRQDAFLSQVPPGQVNLNGKVYLSQTFMTFESEERLPSPQQHLPVCKVVFPLYIVKRVEKIYDGAYTSGVTITTWNSMHHDFYLHVSKSDKIGKGKSC